jgi:ribosomal protein S27E
MRPIIGSFAGVFCGACHNVSNIFSDVNSDIWNQSNRKY